MGLLSFFNQKKSNKIFNADNPIVNESFFKDQTKMLIQAFGEDGTRDILSTLFLQATGQSTEKFPDKNNYKTYEGQINQIHKMYNSITDYGSELLRSIIDVRSAMIAGEGISYVVLDSQSENDESNVKIQALQDNSLQQQDEALNQEPSDPLKEQTENFLDYFLSKNKLDGSKLIKIVETIEKEAKVLLVLEPASDYIKVKIFTKFNDAYNVEKSGNEVTKITYGKDKTPIDLDKAVYIEVSETPRVANVLTQIENYSRATYDLRKNNHLFARTTPFFECQTQQQADALNNDIAKKQWKIGSAYAGTAKLSMVSQTQGASDAVDKERVMLMKDIANTIGISIHLMNYPELMSNRATADSMLEIANASTKKERLIIKEGLIELIEKAMVMSVDVGYDIQCNNPGGFDVELPLISLESLKQIVDVWLPLMQEDIISRATLMNQIPGINPSEEEKVIESEKQARAARAPQMFDNKTTDEMMKELQGDNNNGQGKQQRKFNNGQGNKSGKI